jgi:hypothetical protein
MAASCDGSAATTSTASTPGPWVYLADPVDGTRLWLTGKRSAWVLLGAGRQAATLVSLPQYTPGSDAVVSRLEDRLLVGAPNAARPYDLAALVVARAAGVVVEALPPGPLDGPLDPWAPVAWAGYCNIDVADAFRRRWSAQAPQR